MIPRLTLHFVAVGILAWLAPGSAVQAALTALSQTRSVEANAAASVRGDSDSQSDSESAPDFGPFGSTVDPLAIAIVGADIAIAQGVADQQSSIGLGAITASGEASVSLTLLPGVGGLAEADGESLFDVTFDVVEPGDYSLTGLVDTQAIVTGGADIPLLTNGITFIDVGNATTLFQTLTGDELFGVSGSLGPGSYRLLAFAAADTTQASSLTSPMTVNGLSAFSFNFAFTPSRIPEPGSSLALFAIAAGALGLVPVRVRRARKRRR